MQRVPVDEFIIAPHSAWNSAWFLLTAGEFALGEYNTMTVGWGSFGTMWGKPFAQVVVRPTRHTYSFMERFDSFTLCTSPGRYKKQLTMLGTASGRDGDKIAASGLTPCEALMVRSPLFAEASLAIECRKMYWDDFKPQNFLDPSIEQKYPLKDYHRVYYGEILAVQTA